MCFICKKIKSIIPVTILLKIYNLLGKDDLEVKGGTYYYCQKCYPIFITELIKNNFYIKIKMTDKWYNLPDDYIPLLFGKHISYTCYICNIKIRT